MDNTLRRYHEVVQKALEFMRHPPHNAIGVADVARHVACSPDQLRRIFRTVTGQGVLPNLNRIRIEKARNLLRQTTMSVGEVADATGFDFLSSFTRLFRATTGTSPSLFRKSLQDELDAGAGPSGRSGAAEAGLVARDDFESARLAERWLPLTGQWAPHNGVLRGSGKEMLAVRLAAPLPENFRVEFDLRTTWPMRLHLCLQAEEGGANYLDATFPPGSSDGELQIRRRVVLASPDAFLGPGGWHAVRLELNDNRLTVTLDSRNVFKFRDIFPPNYATRSRFVIQGYDGTVELRRFRLHSLGFLPVVPAVRQGDALFNAGLYQQAKDFYVRHLLPNIRPEEELELRFKIGMCLLRQEEFDYCRSWVEATLPLARDPFWQRECTLLLVSLEASANRFAAFESRVRQAMPDPLLHDGLRPLLRDYYNDLRGIGFYDRMLSVAALALEMDGKYPGPAAQARELLYRPLKNLRRFRQARPLIERQARAAPTRTLQWEALHSMSEILLLEKKIAAARTCNEKVRAAAAPLLVWSVDMQEAICLRTERRFRNAIELLLSVRQRQPTNPGLHFDADIEAALLLGCLRDLDAARKLVSRLRAESPRPDVEQETRLLEFERVAGLIEGRHAELAALLLQESRRQDGQPTVRGQQAVTAGILFELAGNPDEAKRTWNEAARRFMPERCYFWGSLAKALAAGKPDRLESMLLPYRIRSEMFYLAARLYEQRGNAVRARRLLAVAVQEDATLYWPAYLAQERLGRRPPAAARRETPHAGTPATAKSATQRRARGHR
jgi:AraC-like DNA-binding protein/tetratricopeptide (TPR) repeat protein